MKNIETIKSKIAKLINLSQSSNEHEAQIALAQAQRLAMTYQLDLEESVIQEEEEEFIEKNTFVWGREPVIWKHVVHILQNYYDVKVLYQYDYRSKVVSFIGRESKVETAKIIGSYLLRTFEELWVRYKKENGLTNRDKYSYLSGLERGVKSKLNENKKYTVHKRAKELAGSVSEEKLIEKYELAFKKEAEKLENALGEMYPKLRKIQRRSSSFDYRPNVAGDGYSAGRSINVGDRVAGALMG